MVIKKKTKKVAKKVAAPKKNAKPAAKKTGATKAVVKKAVVKKAVVKKAVAKKAVAKKAVAKKAVAAKAKPAKKPAAVKAKARPRAKAAPVQQRRDATGHLNPEYAATLRAKSREGGAPDRDDAFVGRRGRSSDALAEGMGETWVKTATSGEDESEDVFNQEVPEDAGGPFVTSTAGQEFAEGTDGSNPRRSKREPFPRT